MAFRSNSFKLKRIRRSNLFYKLKLKDCLYLLVLIILTYLWINYDQVIFNKAYQRMIAFPILGFLLMMIYFLLVQPGKPMMLSNTMSIILVPLFILLSIVLHVFVFKDGFQTKLILLWFITGGMIYLSGYLYKIIFVR